MDVSGAKTRFLEIYILNVVTELFQTAIYSSLFRKNLVFSVADSTIVVSAPILSII
jgi:hypothetical protein